VIAATNRKLIEKVKSGEFREDLYYRLKVVEVLLPPIRERREDIPSLVDHFCNYFNKTFGKNISGISEEVLRIFMQYSWPGNVRELKHVIEHAFVLCHGGIITVDDLPPEIREYPEIKAFTPEKRATKGRMEILEALNRTDWNKAKAARLLGISRKTIYRKINQYKLTRPD
jgi:transcriptional regulator with PAS, ATPase and Fis domain